MKITKNSSMSPKAQKMLLSVLGVLLVFALCYMCIITPASKKNQPTKTEIASLENQLKEIEHIDVEIENKQSELDKLQAEYDKATEGLPKTDRYPEVFKDIEQMAIDSGATSIKAKFDYPKIVKSKKTGGDNSNNKDDDGLQGMKYFRVDYYFDSTSENTEQILDFVDKIENDDRIADICEIKTQRGKLGAVSVFFYTSGGDEKEEYDFN